MIFAGSFGMTPQERATSIEKRRLAVLEPNTRDFAIGILAWARANGIPAIIGETYRSPEQQAKEIAAGRSGITEGQVGWHQFGRAFHLVIIRPGTKQLDVEAYRRVGEEVRRRGGDWLGDKPITTVKGKVQDLAHFEYHPGLTLWSYRTSAPAQRELAMVAKRAVRYG